MKRKGSKQATEMRKKGKNTGKGGAADSMPTVFQLGRARWSERGKKRVGWSTANTHETLWEPLT